MHLVSFHSKCESPVNVSMLLGQPTDMAVGNHSEHGSDKASNTTVVVGCVKVVVLVLVLVVVASSSARSSSCCGVKSPRVIVAGTNAIVVGGVSFWNPTAIAAHSK